MRRGIAPVLAALLLLAGELPADDSVISHIRKEYQSIQAAVPSLKVEEIELPDSSPEGAGAKAYRDSKGNIRLVRVELFFESGKELEEFYYENGTLIFVFYRSHRYNVPSGSELFDPKKTQITEDRYYFDKGRMVRWLDEHKNQVKPDSTEFRDAEKEVTDMSKEMLSRFGSKEG